MHAECRGHAQALACDGVYCFTNLLGKKDELVPDREEVARVQQAVVGPVDQVVVPLFRKRAPPAECLRGPEVQ